MKKIYISFALLLVYISSYSQSECRLLGRTIGELRFAAQREGIKLGPEVDAGDGRTMVGFENKKPKQNRADLKISDLLFFKLSESERCYMITSIPLVNEKWAADTLIKRLVKRGFTQKDTSTFINNKEGCVVYFESVPYLDEKGKSLEAYTLRLTYYLQEQ